MSEDKFECIVVGGGLAGLTAAYMLANAGREVMLVERGNYCGSKNVTGGRMYGHSMEKIIPGFAESAPVERRIVRERLSHDENGSFVTEECESRDPLIENGESFSILRSRFDRWFADQCEEAGVMLINDILVDDLYVSDGKVCGIVAADEVMESDLVILAEGVNGLLAQKYGMKEALKQEETEVGVKEVIRLSPEIINERFGVADGEGVAWMVNGFEGVADGFLYTNRDSISVGISMPIAKVRETEKSVPEILNDFMNHPEIAPLLEGGVLQEHSAHLFPEGRASSVSKTYGNGILVAGDTAGFCVNFGDTLRGMDLAVESGRLAAETAVKALEQNDFSEEYLSAYQKALEESSVYSILRAVEV